MTGKDYIHVELNLNEYDLERINQLCNRRGLRREILLRALIRDALEAALYAEGG